MKVKALLFDRLAAGAVRCGTCQRKCVIPEGEAGWCGTRENEGGTLFSSIYGEVSSISVNPIEKKPVFHFLPGSRWLSLGSVGCNFRCAGCQNWEISHWVRGDMRTQFLSPEDSVAAAKARGCVGLSWTFNEPTLWLEYTLDAAKAAKQAGLFTNYVTNGAITPEALALLLPCLDVFRVDVKGITAAVLERICGMENADGILDATREAKEYGRHVEVVTNVTPGINDSDSELLRIAEWIAGSLGVDTPWHVTRFFPMHRLQDIDPTPSKTLQRAVDIGRSEGLRFVYTGNVSGISEDTVCYSCGNAAVRRSGYSTEVVGLDNGRCAECGADLNFRVAQPLVHE